MRILDSPEDAARYAADSKLSAFGYEPASYEWWLGVLKDDIIHWLDSHTDIVDANNPDGRRTRALKNAHDKLRHELFGAQRRPQLQGGVAVIDIMSFDFTVEVKDNRVASDLFGDLFRRTGIDGDRGFVPLELVVSRLMAGFPGHILKFRARVVVDAADHAAECREMSDDLDRLAELLTSMRRMCAEIKEHATEMWAHRNDHGRLLVASEAVDVAADSLDAVAEAIADQVADVLAMAEVPT